MNQQTINEIARLDRLRLVKGLTKYRISKDLGIPQMTVGSFFGLDKIPSLENYLRIRNYLESPKWILVIPVSGHFGIVLPEDTSFVKVLSDGEIETLKEIGIYTARYAGKERKDYELIRILVDTGTSEETKGFLFDWKDPSNPDDGEINPFGVEIDGKTLSFRTQ